MSRGWLEALGFVIAVGALSLSYGVGQQWGAHPLAFVLCATLVSGLALVALTGMGAEAIALMRSPLSWFIGIASILVEIFYYLMLIQGHPAHGNVILRATIPMAMAGGWWLLGRRPQPLAVAGGVGIIVASVLALLATAAPQRVALAITTLGGASFVVARSFAMEFHPPNRQARSVRDKLRITGTILFLTSVAGLMLVGLFTVAAQLGWWPHLAMVPTAAQLLHLPTIALAGTLGGGILALMMYLNLSAVVKITTENMIVMMAFIPLSAWLFQAVGAELDLVPPTSVDARLVVALLVLVASVLAVLVATRRRPAD